MNILTINAGSSSLKVQYFENLIPVALLKVEEIGQAISKISFRYGKNSTITTKHIFDHQQAIIILEKLFEDAQLLDTLNSLDAIAHRVVHGGEKYHKPTLITPQVIKDLKSINTLAPLHNPISVQNIENFAKRYTTIPQFAVFDTAFHHTIPLYAYTYALPKYTNSKQHLRKYGFHGISYAYTTTRAAKLLKKPQNKLNLISLHLGNGASITAIKDGKSIDTSMGLTPLSGLIMGSRCGDIDASVVTYLLSQGYSQKDIGEILNNKSGLTALCGTNDIKEITKRYQDNDSKAINAIDTYIYQITKYIGSYYIILKDIDAIVFSGGIGENSSFIRELILKQISHLINDKSIEILVIPTNEEFQMAKEVQSHILNI